MLNKVNAKKNDFNSHAHVERDVIQHFITPTYLNFNSHAHVERDITEVNIHETLAYFNSHAHVERDAVTSPT